MPLAFLVNLETDFKYIYLYLFIYLFFIYNVLLIQLRAGDLHGSFSKS